MKMIKNLFRKITQKEWNIGFLQNSLEDIISGAPIKVIWMKHNYKFGWFADPFILEQTNEEIIVLVEEFYYPINRGRLSVLFVDKKTFELKKVQPLLELETHLSFPAIVRKNGHVYVYPENYQGGGQKVYELDTRVYKLKFLKKISEERLTDAIFCDLFGKKQIFSTDFSNPNGAELGVYEIDDTGLFSKTSSISFSENIARNAGDWFFLNGKVWRPAQESNENYGHAISLQRVNYEKGSFTFTEIRRIASPHPRMKIAFHTLNAYRDTIVVDCQGYRYGKIASFAAKMRTFF